MYMKKFIFKNLFISGKNDFNNFFCKKYFSIKVFETEKIIYIYLVSLFLFIFLDGIFKIKHNFRKKILEKRTKAQFICPK